MERSIQTQAIVVKTAKVGEMHKLVTLLSPDLGLINVMLYGGRKGKKTALAPLFSSGTFQLYHNPVRNEYSLEEAVTTFLPEAIMEDLQCTYAAYLLCEIVAKTSSDEPKPVFELLQRALLLLEKDPQSVQRIIISFIWKFLQISGLAPELEYCPVCERKLEEEEILLFARQLASPACKNCGDSDYLVLPPGARRYLKFTQSLDLERAVAVQLNPPAQARILAYMLKWIKIQVNTPLKTLENYCQIADFSLSSN